MATNVNSTSDNRELQEYIAAAVTAGNVSGIIYPDATICQYVAACVAGGTSAGRPGAPSLEVAQIMFATLGA